MRFTLKRVGALGASVTMAGALLAVGASVATAPSAFADTSQNNGCWGVTSSFSQFAVPITGTATPNPANGTNPGPVFPTVTLNNTSVAISVDSTLIGAGITTGLVSAANSLANLGVTDNTGAPNQSAGIDAVVAAIGSVTLKIHGTNTTNTPNPTDSQTASNTAPASLTFYVTADATGGSVVVYSSVTSPPVLGGPNVPVPGRTGTVLVGALVVTIPLSATTWTPTGASPIVLSELNTAPVNLSLPTAAEQLAAPLIILPKINGAINVPFHCWPGTVSSAAVVPPATTNPLIPGPSSAIDTVVVNAPPSAPSCATPQAASVGGSQSVTVTPQCTNNNPPFVASSANIVLNGANGGALNGTVVVQANGGLLYTNNGNGQNTDTFAYHATNAVGSSNNATVNITVLNNACTTGADSDTGVRSTTPGGPGIAGPDGPEPENPKGASDNPCNLKQVLIVPVAPSTLSMSQAGNQDILGATANLQAQTCGAPIPLTLNGGPQYACGALSEVTVLNARGTDDGWTLTGQVTDFIDGTRGPLDTCSGATSPNITHTPPDNHCIPGGNLGWIPSSSIVDPAIPGDTAAIISGAQILPPIPGVNIPATVTRPVAPLPGLHDAAQVLCYSQDNQSGGTFHCDAGLILGVPGSAAAALTPGYTATLTLTLG